jgi:hypothetical protein
MCNFTTTATSGLGERMKKKYSLGICMVLLIVTSFYVTATAITGSFNSETNEITFTLSKGWNIIPFARGGSSQSDCDISAMYYWSPTDKIYVAGDPKKDLQEQPEEFKSQLGIDQDLYCATPNLGAYWVYSSNSCEIHTYLGYYNSWTDDDVWGVKDKILKKGWNFMTINPYMIGHSFNEILSDCEVEGMNQWQSHSQSWVYGSSKYAADVWVNNEFVNNSTVGLTLVVKVADDCGINTDGEISTPPPLPE